MLVDTVLPPQAGHHLVICQRVTDRDIGQLCSPVGPPLEVVTVCCHGV